MSDKRWDMHSERQVAASKGAATAITVLNSGSWLALLSQAADLQGQGVGVSLGFWGLGALLGTSLWIFIYRGSLLVWEHDQDRSDDDKARKVDCNIKLGVSIAIASLAAFAGGVVSLACALNQ